MKHRCEQCGKDMGFEWFLGSVCGKCCKANHKKVTGAKLTKDEKRRAVRR